MPEKVDGLRCKILRVMYQSNMFAICACQTTLPIPEEAASMSLQVDEAAPVSQFTALGDGLSTDIGKEVLLSGQWEQNKKYGGQQLRISLCEEYTGRGREEVIAYLSSNALKGIGHRTAEIIYDKFGESSIEVLANNPREFLQIPGIKEKKLAALIASYEKNHALHALTRLLAPHNVSFRSIVRIAKTLGPDAAKIVRQNPYILSKVRGFGFLKTDEIALSMGVARDSTFRITGALQYVLVLAQDEDGHLFLPRGELVQRCCSAAILNKNSGNHADRVSPDAVNRVLDSILSSEDGVLRCLSLCGETASREAQRIYEVDAFLDETSSASRIAHLLSSSRRGNDGQFEELVKQVQSDLGVSLDEIQEQAVLMALTETISIITGGPGTGKTTTLNVLVEAKERLLNESSPGIFLAAPTGRAARRMREQTGREASTLHSLLGILPGDESKNSDVEDDILEADMLIIDEASMIDAHMLAVLTDQLHEDTQVVFVGDVDQLPSVGAGNVLKQLLMTSAIRHVKLEKIFRQGEGSVIPVNSKRINAGRKDLKYNQYFKLFQCESEVEGAQYITQMMESAARRDMLEGVQILAPMRRRGAASINALNECLHDVTNPPSPEKEQAVVGTTCFRVGDRVMHTTRNTGEASNGDIGRIIHIAPMTGTDRDTFSLTVEYAPDWTVEYSYADALDYLEPAMAITIHKSQGSEFDVVVIPLFKSMSFFLQRNLLYTAVTRAKRQVVIVGQPEAIATAISKVDSRYRNTMLSALITEEVAAAGRKPSLL